MGYDKERGDTLSVINSAFNTAPLRPMTKNIVRPPAPPPVELLPATAEASASPPPQQQVSQTGDRYENNLRNAREIAKQDPKIVAHVVKDWVAGNEQ
jgi:flagellar M-ring protein FliF